MSSFYYGSWLLRYFPKARLSFSVPICLLWASLVAQMVKNLLPTWETWVRFPGQEDPWRRECPTPLHAIYTSDPWVLVQVSSVPWAQLCLTLGDWLWSPPRSCPWNFPSKTIGGSCHFLLGGISQGSSRASCTSCVGGLCLSTAPPGKLLSSKAVWTQIYSVKCETTGQDFGAIVIWLTAYYIDLKINFEVNYFCRFIT